MRQRGFTLIELLVVIAIIALLSTVILASLNDARAKARNSQRLQILAEYRNALELARDASGQYPSVTSFVCLGNPSDGICMNNRAVDTGLVTAVTPYMSELPLAPAPVTMPTYDGMMYYSDCPALGSCSGANQAYGVIWYMEGNTSCGPGTGTYNASLNTTNCNYRHY